MILIDEIQNYLPEQIAILQSCIAPETGAMTYVGDLAQQTSLFTLRDWDTVGEQWEKGRAVKLEKVYRSTRQILEYIRSVGYEVEVPSGAREGKPVQKLQRPSEIKKIVRDNPDIQIGILGISPEDIEPYRNFASKHARVMTIHHAQGVEFDIAIFVEGAVDTSDYPEALRLEKNKIIRDQTYVGLTRAMNELYILPTAREAE